MTGLRIAVPTVAIAIFLIAFLVTCFNVKRKQRKAISLILSLSHGPFVIRRSRFHFCSCGKIGGRVAENDYEAMLNI